jgi:FKBP-type peptidyl-prolyl cis-trans isomerase
MRPTVASILVILLVSSLAGCPSKKAEDKPAAPAVADAGTPAKTGEIPAPPDVAAPPADAEKAASGLAWKVLSKGTGTAHPTANDTVTVNYTGWTTDGKMFESSTKRGQPASFALGSVIKGWTEGIQLMTEGEKRRIWIPVELAYQGRPGRPAGMLVFDIELLAIKEGPRPPADVAAPAKDAVKKGEVFVKTVEPGTGPAIKATSFVRLHYNIWDTEGKLLESSMMRGRPAPIKMDSAPAGFKEGLPGMKQGEKSIMWVPKAIAAKLGPQDLKGDYLTFELNVVFVYDVDPPPDVKAPPADAKKEKDGLASKILKHGPGTEHPTKDSTVKVNYTGWTTDGKMFDSSVVHDGPAQFSLGAVIPGWTEGIQLMTEGEKRRFWIPAELAYKGKSGPQGLLVFDLELLQIVKKVP